jgi:hypothetical protein
MSTAMHEQLLAYKREQSEHHYAQFLRFKREADSLEEQLDRGETPDLPASSVMMDEPFMSKREKTEVRMRQVLALFEQKRAEAALSSSMT